MYICPATYTNRHLHTHTHRHTLASPRALELFIQITHDQTLKKTKQSKNSPNSQRSLSWHEVCFAPNASIAYFDSPLICFVSSLLDYAPSLSLTELGGGGFFGRAKSLSSLQWLLSLAAGPPGGSRGKHCVFLSIRVRDGLSPLL